MRFKSVFISDHWQKSEIAISANWKISKMNYALLKNKLKTPVYFLEWQVKNFAKDWIKYSFHNHVSVTKNVNVTKRVNVNKNANVTNPLNLCKCKINSKSAKSFFYLNQTSSSSSVLVSFLASSSSSLPSGEDGRESPSPLWIHFSEKSSKKSF